MATKHYTQDDIRRRLKTAVALGSQADLARKIGVDPRNLSPMVNGAPINGKTLRWLGFRPVKGLYERIKEEA